MKCGRYAKARSLVLNISEAMEDVETKRHLGAQMRRYRRGTYLVEMLCKDLYKDGPKKVKMTNDWRGGELEGRRGFFLLRGFLNKDVTRRVKKNQKDQARGMVLVISHDYMFLSLWLYK